MTPSPPAATLMLVDDTPANLDLLGEMLRSRGYRVVAFPSGSLALAAAARQAPDLVLLDVDMPEMNGFEVCERLKSSPEPALRDVPVMFLSALSETADKLRAFALGGVDYVTKPFQVDEVVARVRTHLQIREQQRALALANRTLRELEETRDALVHMVVHDMRSPLTVVMSNLEWLGEIPVESDVRQALEDSASACRALAGMINSVLDVSRLEAAQLPVEMSRVDAYGLVTATFRDAEIRRGGRTIALDLPEHLDPIDCDAALLGRVLANLLDNALKFTAEDGTIRLRVVGSDHDFRVEVEDDGPGIPPALHARIFDKFFQVAARQQGIKRSTGLGLTFCKLAIEALGGRIGVDSDTGHGSRFWFELPRVHGAPAGGARAGGAFTA